MRMILSILYAPCVYFALKYFGIAMDEVLYMKAFPLLLSVSITFLMIVSYSKKKSMILYFAQKFSKVDISEDEKEYIHNSTLFWIAVSCINVCIHTFVFFDIDEKIWVFYSSIGWYFLFLVAGMFQFLHRKFIFFKDKNV